MVSSITDKIDTFNAQDTSNALNALSKWNISLTETPYRETILCLVRNISQRIHSFNAQDISNSLNALAKWDISANETPYSKAISCLVLSISRQINIFTAQDVSNSLNALSKWDISLTETPYQQSIPCLIRAIPKQIDKLNAQNIANSLNALAKWPILANEKFYKKTILCLLTIIPEKIAYFSAQNLANSLNALAKWRLPIQQKPYRTSLQCLLKQVEKTVKFNAHEGISLAFALCLFKFIAPDDNLFENNEKIIQSLFARHKKIWLKQLDDTVARQIYQINCYQPNIIPLEFINAIPSFTSNFKQSRLISSELQKSVLAHLGQLKLNFVAEYFIKFTHVDLANPKNKVALQVNGPYHYEGEILNVSSQFNNHLLEKLGWSVIMVAYFEWDKLNNHQKEAYLSDKLSPCIKKPSLYRVHPGNIKTINRYKSIAIQEAISVSTQQPKLEKKRIRNRKLKKVILTPLKQIWNDLIEKKVILEKVRPDELQTAYGIFTSAYRTTVMQDALKSPQELDAFKKITAEQLDQAIYLKKIELFSQKTIAAFFQCKPYQYGLRLDANSHPSIAFSQANLKVSFQKRCR